MTFRRFRALVRGLPASARVWSETNGGWSLTDHLLADVFDALERLRSAVIATASTPPGKPLRGPEPVQYVRPGAPKKTKPPWGDLARRLRGGEHG